jgi:hypothetical protein
MQHLLEFHDLRLRRCAWAVEITEPAHHVRSVAACGVDDAQVFEGSVAICQAAAVGAQEHFAIPDD